MAITFKNSTRPKEGTDAYTIDLFQFDQALLADNEIARQAQRRGLLAAKSSALGQAQLLARVGLILLACTLAVSFLHIFHTLASYVPADITPVDPPDWIWHTSAALLTLIIDAIALYVVLVANTAAFAGHQQTQILVWFFYALTGLLNGVFFVSYVPSAPTWIVEALDAGFATIIIILMTLLVPISIIAVKNAMQIAETARLQLTVECETLRGLVDETSTTGQAQAASTTTSTKPNQMDTPTHHAAAWPQLEDGVPHAIGTTTSQMDDDAAKPSPMPETAAHPTPSTDNAPGGALHSSTLGIPGISELPEKAPVADRICPKCGRALSAAQYGAARRWGHCKTCKEA